MDNAAAHRHRLITRHLEIAGHWKSCRLKASTWEVLCDIARREDLSIDELCAQIAAARPEMHSLAAAIRAWLPGHVRQHMAGDDASVSDVPSTDETMAVRRRFGPDAAKVYARWQRRKHLRQLQARARR